MQRNHGIARRSSLLLASIALSAMACSTPPVVTEDAGEDRATPPSDASADGAAVADSSALDASGASDVVDASVAVDSGADATGADGSSPADAATVLRDRYPLTARFTEGGAFDPSQRAFYVGSLADGSVHRVDGASGEDRMVFRETAAGRWWTLGMDVDVARNRLWVCAMDDRSPSPRAGFVWVFDTRTHERVATVPLSTANADATCTDVAVTADGTGYVCDREQGKVYRLRLGSAPTVFASDDLLSASFVGQNAIVVLPDESALLTVLYGPPSLARVDLRTGAVRRVTINGRFSDLTPLAGADGMTFANGSAYVAFSSKLIRVTPTLADWSRADSTNVDLPNGMTDVISTPDGLYLLNGQSVRFATGGATDPFALVRFTGTL